MSTVAWRRHARLLALAALGVVLFVWPAAGRAQSAEEIRRLQQLSPAERQALLERVQQVQSGQEADPTSEPGLQELPAASAVILPMSEIAESVAPDSARFEPIEEPGPSDQFGASFFRGDPALFGAQTFGPVPESYIIGPGDEITVDVWGEVEFRHERVVDRDGTITLPRAGRITAANRDLAQLEQRVREVLSRSYSGIDPNGQGGTTFVDVSLGRLRAIRVFVVGEVERPGAYELTSVSTVFTALHAAGGPNVQGSLRRVRLMRGSEAIASLDLYDYLLRGERTGDVILREGDTVFVPARELSVQITGAVRRPMFYELMPEEGVADLVRFAGGFSVTAVTQRVHVNRVLPPEDRVPGEPDRVQRDLDLADVPNPPLFDGDIVRVGSIPDRLFNVVEVDGNVKNAGRYEYVPRETVSGLIERADGLWDDTLMERATLDRIQPDGTYRSVEIRLGAVLSGQASDVVLQPRDVLRVFSIWDIQDRFEVSITGEVRSPGDVAWREGMTLRELVLKAGGLKQSADVLRAEVSRLRVGALTAANSAEQPERTIDVITVTLGEDWLSGAAEPFYLEPHDRVRVRRLPWWELQRTVTLRGEVMYPGEYSLETPNERLSSVILRAGGLKPTAYPPAARLERSQDSIGRVALDLAKAMEDQGHDQDVILESGDVIIVPPEPYTVRVAGAVNFPTSIVWENGKKLGYYVARAGGYDESADKWGAHVVYPNGMSRPIRRFWWDPEVRPGSTVVVPVKAPDEGESKLSILREIAAIGASLATVWLVVDRTN